MGCCADDYCRLGSQYGRAYEIMAARCDYPPSLELFTQELADRRKRQTIGPLELAEMISAGYRRIQGV